MLGAAAPATVSELARSRPRGARSLAVLLDVAAWANANEESAPDPAGAARLLRGAGWQVAVARPTLSMDQVWRELGQGVSTPTEVG